MYLAVLGNAYILPISSDGSFVNGTATLNVKVYQFLIAFYTKTN